MSIDPDQPRDPYPGDSASRPDRRSMALHACAAAELLLDSTLVDVQVIPTIERFLRVHAGTGTESLVREWEHAARAGVRALVDLSLDPTEHGQQLRSASCVLGVVSQRTRRRVFEIYGGPDLREGADGRGTLEGPIGGGLGGACG